MSDLLAVVVAVLLLERYCGGCVVGAGHASDDGDDCAAGVILLCS